jgi:hypothetical protein
MPSYFPENNASLPTDTVERSLQKAVDLIGSAAGGSVSPSPGDSSETLAQKLVRSLNASSSTVAGFFQLRSADNSVWSLSIDNNGVLSATKQ